MPAEELDHADRCLTVYGRLKPAVTVEAGQRDLASTADREAVAFRKTNDGWSITTIPLIDQLVGRVRPALVMLLAAAGCVLLIGAANLANPFLGDDLGLGRGAWFLSPPAPLGSAD